ncbi:MAG: ABC transporter ATP-binding protein [Clostridia bacterium]|nr:ABC transporter ATP-binding protein [Clostridia bacterium]
MADNIEKETEIAKQSEEPIIEFKNVTKVYTLYKNSREQFKALFFKSKKYKRHNALNGVNFKINKGESVAIIGKNGAGKSTVLKMITGVAFPTSGEVNVKGRVAALLELTAGFVPDMTGRENISFKCYVLGLKESEIKEIEQNVIDFADLGEYIDQPVRTYSSGMKMRLGFAININMNPDILVIDEALSVGDAAFKKKCKAKIREMIQRDITVLYVSHGKDIREICERCIYLQKGTVIFDGGMEETLKKYPEFAK